MAANKPAIKPIGGNILVKPQEAETTTPSGLVISTNSSKSEKPKQGKVVALGTGKLDKDGKQIAWNVKVGDDVVFKQYSPDEVEIENETYLILREEDVLAVVG